MNLSLHLQSTQSYGLSTMINPLSTKYNDENTIKYFFVVAHKARYNIGVWLCVAKKSWYPFYYYFFNFIRSFVEYLSLSEYSTKCFWIYWESLIKYPRFYNIFIFSFDSPVARNLSKDPIMPGLGETLHTMSLKIAHKKNYN